MPAMSPQKRQRIVEQWLSLTLGTYPEHTAQFLLREKDAFRNPVGRALREGLPVLLDELCGAMNSSSLVPALEDIIRIGAVQAFSPSQALAFIFLLKGIIRESGIPPGELTSIEERIERMALLGFDLFMTCREKIYEVKAGEVRRRVDLLERMHAETL